jgi:hypothetical protein
VGVYARLVTWAVLFAGCTCTEEPTALMIEVDSNLELAEMDRVRFQVDSVEPPDMRTPRLDTTYLLERRAPDGTGGEIPGSSKVMLPIRIAVLPRAETDSTVHVAASGLAPGAGGGFVTTTATLSFVPGRTLLLRLFLDGACGLVECEDGQTCVASLGEAICAPDSIDRPECALPDVESGLVEPCEPIQGCVAEPGCCGGACVACCGASDCPDDGNECTGPATCEHGFCIYPPQPGPCAGDGDECTVDSCDWDVCSHKAIEGCP